MIVESQLAPCPFCGSKAEYERIGTQRVSCQIACTMCGCSLETGETWDSGHSWNKRAVLVNVNGLITVAELRRCFAAEYPSTEYTHVRRAEILGLLPGSVENIVNGRRPPSKKFLNAVGYERVSLYRKKSNAD